MRIFAGGIATETNTFSPLLTGIEDFLVQRGSDASVNHPGLDLGQIWGEQARAAGHTFIFSLMAWAQPSGPTVTSAYESLRDEMLRDLRAAMPVDVVLLMLHGAMVAAEYDDCEEDIIRRVREIVGAGAIIGVELDLHCHLSAEKIASADIVITYKEYPHVDVNERAREIFELATSAALGKSQPVMALFDCQMVGLYPTSRQPCRDLVNSLLDAERHPGVLSISFGHGFQYADLPHVGAKMLVVADNDRELAARIARDYGLRAYALRRQISFDQLSLPMTEALSRAVAATRTPVVVADQSDNTGGGAPGDATFALRWLLDHGAEDVAMAIFYDPEVVRLATKAGPGARLPVRLGGKMGPFSGAPVDIEVSVIAVRADYIHRFPQQSGDPWLFPTGSIVALRCDTIDIVVSSERCQCFCPSIFSDLGIDPKRKRVLIPKSAQHFHGAFAPIAAEVIYMAGPGAVAPDPRTIPYRRLQTERLYPWSDDPLASDAR